MNRAQYKHYRPGMPVYLVCYALYALLLVLIYFEFWGWQHAIGLASVLLLGRNATADLVYQGLTVLTGLVLFLIAIAAESYLRSGVRERRLVSRAIRLSVPLAFALAIAGVLSGAISGLIPVDLP